MRRGRIARAIVNKHGKTPGCPKCYETGVHHNETRRDRFEKIWYQEAMGAASGLEATSVRSAAAA